MSHTVAKNISYPKAAVFSGIIGGVGYLVARKITSMNPLIGFLVPSTTLFILTVALKTKYIALKVISILALPFIPIAIGKGFGISISIPASLGTIAMAFIPIYLLGLYLRKPAAA
ncbi:MAG: hypothetical protein H0V82_02760 [Candidatus Protochlamydia sp.]|nr:hypothetical protein [Candidatus Protochlamydia sp.]